MEEAEFHDAGPFSNWLTTMVKAIEIRGEMDVPCGECNACCRSSQFVLVAPDETRTKAHIDPDLLFPAPGLPGHEVLGFAPDGTCAMLEDNSCTIYEHRPRTCRTYDCRVFTATGINPDDVKVDIKQRVDSWRFAAASESDQRLLAAAQRAGRSLTERANEIFGDPEPPPTQLAAMALTTHDLFAEPGDPPNAEAIRERLRPPPASK